METESQACSQVGQRENWRTQGTDGGTNGSGNEVAGTMLVVGGDVGGCAGGETVSGATTVIDGDQGQWERLNSKALGPLPAIPLPPASACKPLSLYRMERRLRIRDWPSLLLRCPTAADAHLFGRIILPLDLPFRLAHTLAASFPDPGSSGRPYRSSAS